jgi:hypothetical protein
MPYMRVGIEWARNLSVFRVMAELWGLNCPKSRVPFVYRAHAPVTVVYYGRADFYIPAKEWGVELYRSGDRLTEHSGRFSSGAYQIDISLDRYIIRETRPQRPHPGMCICFSLVIFAYSGLQTLRICTMLYSATTSKRYRF